MNYDLIVIGSGPGGYVAAVKSAQKGLKTAVVERENLGGICLNWGCIPTKALLKSAQVLNYMGHAANYGVVAQPAEADITAMVERSRGVASTMSKGVEFLMKKNNVDVIKGTAKVKPGHKIDVVDAEGNVSEYEANHIIIATGARSRVMPNLPQDGKKIIEFINAYVDKVNKIVVHCEAGISRSAGVCAALMQIINGNDFEVFNNPRYCPNMSCYRTVLEAYYGSYDKEAADEKIAHNIRIWRVQEGLD